VPVLKKDGSVRICGDYKVTINQAFKVNCYPLPRIDDLLASFVGGKTFPKLDLAHAYQQIPLDDASKKPVDTEDCFSTTDFLLVFQLPHPYFKRLWKHFFKGFLEYPNHREDRSGTPD